MSQNISAEKYFGGGDSRTDDTLYGARDTTKAGERWERLLY